MKEAHKLLLAALIEDGLTYGDAQPMFAAHHAKEVPYWRDFVQAAGRIYCDGECYEIDDHPIPSYGGPEFGGMWVSGWFWVTNEMAGFATCDECQHAYVEDGDGYDGLCPSCADKAEADDDDT